MLRFPYGLLIILSLISCTNSIGLKEQNDRILAQQENLDGSACFSAKGIDSWRVLNERFLIVYSPTINRPWLVELAHRCGGLRTGSVVAFSGSFHERQICAKENDILLGNIACGISGIYPMTKQQSIRLIKKNQEARKKREERLKNQ